MIEKIQRKFTKNEVIFVFSWCLFSISVLLELTVLANSSICVLTKLLRYIAYILSVISVIDRAFEVKVIRRIIVSLLILMMGAVVCNNKTLFLYMFIIIGGYRFPARVFIKCSKTIMGVVLWGVILLSQLGIVSDDLYIYGDRVRHGMGFVWTTTGSILFLFYVLQWIYLRRDNMKIWEYFFLEALNYWLFKCTDARMSFGLLTMFLAFVFVASKGNIILLLTEWLKKFVIILPILVCLISVMMHLHYDANNYYMDKINKLLSGRLELGKKAIDKYGFPLLGRDIQWVGFSRNKRGSLNTYNYVDSSYVQLLLSYGIIVLALVIIGYCVILYKAYKVNDFYLVWIVCIILVFSITEPRLINLAFNPFPVLVLCDMVDCNADVSSKLEFQV